MPSFLRRLRARLKYGRHEQDLIRELALHREMAERDARDAGFSGEDARSRAARIVGNHTLAREEARSVWIARWIDASWQDGRYAVRTLRRNPGFAATAVGALVLGISLNVSLFTVFNAVALRPWDVPNPQRVVLIQPVRPDTSISGMSPVEIRYLQSRSHSAEVIGFSEVRLQLGDDPTAPSSPARLVSSNYFSTLKIGLQLGQAFMPSDDAPASTRNVVVIGARAWRTRFNADPAVIGREVKLNNVPFIVVGVAADDARDSVLSPPPDAWLPIAALPSIQPHDDWSRKLPIDVTYCCVKTAARLKDGVSLEAAAADLAGLDRQFMAEHPELATTPSGGGALRVTTTRMIDQPQAARFVPAFYLMFGGTGLLLLLACANVGNLLLARAMARQREIGVRLALGAGRSRVIRQLLTEGMVLAILGAIGALPIANALPRIVFSFLETSKVAPVLTFALDRAVLGFSMAIAIVSSLLFSLAPALRGTRALASSVRGGRGGAGKLTLRTALLTVQVAISAVLLVSAGLLGRGILRASTADLGFRTDGILTATISLPINAYQKDAEKALGAEFERRLEQAGIGAIGATNLRPLSQSRRAMRMPITPDGPPTRVEFHEVSPGYFGLLGIRVSSGRVFNSGEAHAIVVNRTLAEALGGDLAIGKSLQPDSTPETIVGIVEDAQLTGLGKVAPTFFRAPEGFSPYVMTRDSAQAAAVLRATIAELEPRAIVEMARLSDGMREEVRTGGIGAGVAVMLALSAILLAGIGVFGVFSFMVTERSREIGVRLALGAGHGDVARTVLGGAAVALGGGLVLGLVLAALAGSLLDNALYGLSPRDPIAFGAAIAVLGFAAMLSTALPVWRALKIDPSTTLRQD